jgi:hypothetical protein
MLQGLMAAAATAYGAWRSSRGGNSKKAANYANDINVNTGHVRDWYAELRRGTPRMAEYSKYLTPEEIDQLEAYHIQQVQNDAYWPGLGTHYASKVTGEYWDMVPLSGIAKDVDEYVNYKMSLPENQPKTTIEVGTSKPSTSELAEDEDSDDDSEEKSEEIKGIKPTVPMPSMFKELVADLKSIKQTLYAPRDSQAQGKNYQPYIWMALAVAGVLYLTRSKR